MRRVRSKFGSDLRLGRSGWTVSVRGLVLLLLPLTVYAGQSLVLTPGVKGTVVDPNLPQEQSWRVEFQVSDWTLPPQGVYSAYLFYLGGTGASVLIYPDGRLAFTDLRDSVSRRQPCFLSLAGHTSILARFQRDTAQKRIVCESWNSDGSGYQRDQDTIAASPAWGSSGGSMGNANTSAALGFLRVSKGVVPDGSQPPTGWNAGDWTELKLDGTLEDASGNGHNATLIGAAYTTTAALPPTAIARGYGVPSWSKFSTLRAGYPARLDGSGSYSLESPKLNYAWQQLEGPTTVRWSDTTSSTPTIEGLIFGTYKFRLQVTDGNGGTGSTDVEVGAVATDDNGVVVYPDSKLDILLGPSKMFGANPWEWLDYRNQELFETWADKYEINGGTWRLETDLKSVNGIPRNGTVYATAGSNKIYGVGTNFKDVFCGGQTGPAVGTPFMVPRIPEVAANQTPRPYPRLMVSCQSDTEITMASGWVWERGTVNPPGVAWGTWNICTDCGDWKGESTQSNINFYDNALADYALYYRSGWNKARDSARWLADRWYRSPWILGTMTTPRDYALASTYIRAAVDGGNPDYDLWPSLRQFTDRCYSSYGYAHKGTIADVREASYCLAFTGLQGLLDPDPANKAVAQSRLVDSYDWMWGTQQHPNGNYVSTEIEGDFSRTFAVSHGSTVVTRVLGDPIPPDYCGVPYASGGTISLSTDRVTISGTGTNFTGSAGKVIVLRGKLDGQPWSMIAKIASSPAPTVNSLTLVHPWRGDLGSVSGSQWRIYNAGILNTGSNTMFFGQTDAKGVYPSPRILDTDNWYWCTVVDGNTFILDKPYTGDTSGGNVYRRPTWQILTGQGSQPFMHGITAWGLNYASEALKGYNDAVSDQYRASMNKVVDWTWNYGRNPATNGLFYGVEFSNCWNLTILPALACGQDQSGSSNERAYDVETNSGFARKYLNTRSGDDLARGDQWYTFQFARQGYASPFPGDGYYAEVIDPCCWKYSNEKGYGQVFGVGQSYQWPAARLGGVSPPIPQMVSLDLDLGQAASARVTVTQPSSATTQYLCSSSPCQVEVDARQGAHWAQIEYLSSTGQVLSKTQPDLISGSGVSISVTGAVVTPAIITLSASQTVQFTATFSGTTDSGVTWSISPAVGSISSSGLYTAPADVTASQSVLVRATSLADNSKSATSVITLSPLPISTGPSADSVSPDASDGPGQTFTFVFSDGQSATNLTTAAIVFAPALEAQNSCYVLYDQNSGTIRLDWDDITGYEIKPVGSSDILQNSQCAIGASSVTMADRSITITLDITFTSAFAGPKNIYMYAAEGDGSTNTAWIQKGTYAVVAPPKP
jgi:K319L-like, PKD domain